MHLFYCTSYPVQKVAPSLRLCCRIVFFMCDESGIRKDKIHLAIFALNKVRAHFQPECNAETDVFLTLTAEVTALRALFLQFLRHFVSWISCLAVLASCYILTEPCCWSFSRRASCFAFGEMSCGWGRSWMFAAAAVVTVFLLDVVVFARAKVKDLLVHRGSVFVD